MSERMSPEEIVRREGGENLVLFMDEVESIMLDKEPGARRWRDAFAGDVDYLSRMASAFAAGLRSVVSRAVSNYLRLTESRPGVPAAGSVWTHVRSGHLYRVVGSCRVEAWATSRDDHTTGLSVLYTRIDGDAVDVWARPVSEFMDGRFQPAV